MEDLDSHIVEERARRYKPDTLDKLCMRTHFSKKELQILYRGFKQACPTGLLDEETFLNIYAQFFPLGDASSYAGFVFKTFDKDSSGTISFEEFLVGLSILARGSATDKLQWAFSLYDVNGDGVITRNEMFAIVSSIYDMVGYITEPPVDQASIREHVDSIFDRMDDNKDGIITKQEFLDKCLNDQNIVGSILMFDTHV